MQETVSLKKSILWNLYKFFIFFDMLVSFRAWFTWNINLMYWGAISTMIGGVLYVLNHQWFARHNDLVWLPLLYFAVILGVDSFSPGLISAALLPFLPLFFITALHPFYKYDLLESLFKYMSILLGISVIAWIVHLFGISWLYIPMGYGLDEGGFNKYLFENHFLFLVNITRFDSGAFPRFSSIFIEPGYLGCLMSVILFLRKYRIDKKNIVFFLSLLFSFSLAGIILMFLSFLLYSFRYSQKNIRPTIIGILFMGALYGIGMIYNDGDNAIKKGLIDRLEYDESKQHIAGYDRSAELTDDYFWDFFINSDYLLFGGKQAEISKGGDVDWKAYIISHGLIGFIFVIVFLLYPVLSVRHDKYDFAVFSLLYVLIFSSTIHLFISSMYMVLYILGINSIKYRKMIQKDNL